MSVINDDSPRAIREVLAHHHIALKKRWGQNFMIDPAARERIIAELAPRAGDLVWEIGPGLGAISAALVRRVSPRRADSGVDCPGAVVLFEIDWGLIERLNERFGDRVEIVPGDAVKTIIERVMAGARPPDLVCGNLPYRSGAAIITTVLGSDALLQSVRRMVFTVQLESAQRLVACPGSKVYSSFSVMVQLSARADLVGKLAPGSFFPAPEVRSAVVSLTPAPDAERGRASVLAQALFRARRKTTRNNVPAAAAALNVPPETVAAAVTAAGFDLGDRPESIPPAGYARIARLLPDADGAGPR